MEEILFKGKDVVGNWYAGNLAVVKQDMHNGAGTIKAGSYISNACGAPFAYQVRPETVGQFTNNYDYYTKEKLFEGDVMERGGKRFVIKFSGCGFVGEQIDRPNFTVSLCLLCHLTSEFRLPGKKIGNIHDNPELLEVVE